MSQVTENKVISAPVPMTPLQEFWHYFKRNKGAVVGLVYVGRKAAAWRTCWAPMT